MPWSPCRQKQQRVLFANRVGFFDFTKQILRISELRFELLAYFRSNVVAAGVNPGADGRFNIFGQRTEAAAHFSHSLFDNALDRAAPTRMEDSHGSLLGVDQNNRQAIGGLDAKENAGRAGDEAIAD